MSKAIIYLDYAAGTPSVFSAPKFVGHRTFYNPDALYAGAVESQQVLEESRRRLAQALAVKAQQLFFLPGATVINNLVAETVKKTYGGRVAALNIDHDSLRLVADQELAVNQQTGQLSQETILGLGDDICLLSLAGVNSETGLKHNFRNIKKSRRLLLRRRLRAGCQQPLFLHVDASQMVLTDNPQPQALAEADFVTLNGGKFYALAQSGCLYVAQKKAWQHSLRGGDQEGGWYPGTPSILAAEILSQALSWVSQQRLAQSRRLRAMQLEFEDQLQKLGAEIVLKKAERSCSLTMALLPAADNEWLALQLSQRGIYVGLGSACHSQLNSWRKSSLRHLGYQKAAIYSALRFSFGYETKPKDLRKTIAVLRELLVDQKGSAKG